MPKLPTDASATASSPHIFKHFSTLQDIREAAGQREKRTY
jgi:hypothetical protein